MVTGAARCTRESGAEPWKWAQKAGVMLDYPQPIVITKRQGCERWQRTKKRGKELIKRSERFIRYGAGLL